MAHTIRRVLILGCLPVLLLATSNCATQFRGSAYFSGGAAACEAKCRRDGLEMGGFVYVGEYSSACVCQKPGSTAALDPAGVVAPAAGVAMQMQRSQQANKQH